MVIRLLESREKIFRENKRWFSLLTPEKGEQPFTSFEHKICTQDFFRIRMQRFSYVDHSMIYISDTMQVLKAFQSTSTIIVYN